MGAAGRLFEERPVLKMMYCTLICVTEKWRGIKKSDLERRQLEPLQEQLRGKHRNEVKPAVEPASDATRIYITDGT